MNGLERRAARAEKRVRRADKRFEAPTPAEYEWARHTQDRHFALTKWRECVHEENDLIIGRTTELPPYTDEEANFLANWEAGDSQRAQEICDRFDRANGRVPWSDMTPAQRERELERQRQEADRNGREIHALIAKCKAEEEEAKEEDAERDEPSTADLPRPQK
jgi:hypothetical protein